MSPPGGQRIHGARSPPLFGSCPHPTGRTRRCIGCTRPSPTPSPSPCPSYMTPSAGVGGGSIPWLFATCSKGDANETPLVHLSSFFVFPSFSDAITSTLPFHLRHRRLSKFLFGAQWGRGLERKLPNGWLAPINTLHGSSSRKALDSSNSPTSAKTSFWVAVSLKTCSVHRDPRSSGH